ncbi:MAG TPA: hypothetical protein VFD92_11160 [Candidatus Binatia bacterium]|nr:hypothetical protein [Candidatus Binatia bacterium]
MAKQGTARGTRARTWTSARAATAALCVVSAFSGSAAHAGVWRSNGPSGGAVQTLAVDPSDPTTVYAGSDGGGFFKSLDGGDTWKATGTDIFQISALDVTGIVVDPTNPSRVYASAMTNPNAFAFKSEDGGATWTSQVIGELATGIAIDPTTPSTLYISGFPSVFKSTDAGATWASALSGPGFSVMVDPTTSAVYAGLDNSVAKSIDGGAHWTFSTTSFGGARIETLTVDPIDPSILYAGPSGSAVFKSTDGGKTWAGIGPVLSPFPFNATRIIVDPSDHDVVYAAGLAFGAPGVFKTIDGGATWTPTSLVDPAFSLAMIDSQTLVAGNFVVGISKTVDAAATWFPSGTGLAATTVTSLATDSAHPGGVWAGRTGNHVARSDDGGATWRNPAGIGIPSNVNQIYALAVDPSAPGTAYAGFFPIGGVAKTVDGGEHWTLFDAPPPSSMLTLALALDSSDPANIWSAGFGSGVSRSTNHGVDWTVLGNGIPQIVTSLAIDPSAPSTVYAGSILGGGSPAAVYKTTDAGAHWAPMDTGISELDGQVVIALAIDPSAPSTVYAGTSGAGVFKTIDGGASWNAVNDGLGALDVTSLVADAAVPGTVYAGTHVGVYTTIDGGASWSRSNVGLFNPDVRSLAAERGRVYAGTAGNGAFAMDVPTTPAKAVLGRSFSVKNPGTPPARKLTASALEARSDAPFDRAHIMAQGATLTISVTGEVDGEQTFELPPPWAAAGASGVKYSDPKGIHGPVKAVTLKKTSSGTFAMSVQLVGNTGSAPQPHIGIVPPRPGSSARVLLAVNGGDAYCLGFGGAAGGAIVNTPTSFSVTRPTSRACP